MAQAPQPALNAYITHLDRRLAELRLILADVVCLPHMKDRERIKLIQKWQKAAQGPRIIQKATPAALSMFAIEYYQPQPKTEDKVTEGT